MLMTMPMAKIDAYSTETVNRTRVRVPLDLDLLIRSRTRSIVSTYAAPIQTKDASAAWPVISPNTVTIIKMRQPSHQC